VREPKAIHFSYQRYLTNRIREGLGFGNVPIRLIFRLRHRDKEK
jgi:GTP-binding protein